MSYLHNTGLRRLFAIVFLIAGLLVQVQTLYACGLMDEGQSTECCCGEQMEKGCAAGGGCLSTADSTATGCCDVSVDVETLDSAVNVTTDARLVIQHDAPQPPPALLVSTGPTIFPSEPVNTIFDHRSPPFWLSGAYTYLVTQRFRI